MARSEQKNSQNRTTASGAEQSRVGHGRPNMVRTTEQTKTENCKVDNVGHSALKVCNCTGFLLNK